MTDKPDDRIKPNGQIAGTPRIVRTAEIKIPDKEVHIKTPGAEEPDDGVCGCYPVCSYVPVAACNCDAVCSCDSVCATDACACHPFDACASHLCTCQPECTTCTTGCTTGICTCVPVYWRK
jgi:hypothetical protein